METLIISKKYEKVWEEDFSVEGSLDEKKWTYDLGGGGWGNGEEQIYTKDQKNVCIKEKELIIQALKQDSVITSARISTYGRSSWQYGLFIFEAKVPKGKGLWPAIWLLSDDYHSDLRWPDCGEIDILEHIGNQPGKLHFSIHSKNHNFINNSQMTKIVQVDNIADVYRQYALEWTKEYMSFYLDGILIKKFYKRYLESEDYSNQWPFDKKFHIICNLAVGGYWPRIVSNDAFPGKFCISRIEVYQKKEI